MNEKLDNKLCQDFPLLYSDRNGNMRQTGMAFGFSHGDGWEPIIRKLSEKLEPMIQKLIDENEIGCVCGHEKYEHDQKCSHVFEVSQWNDKELPCSCSGYFSNHPRASQVKEKYGTLRFYMTSSTKEMQDEISIAEGASSKTCESCGGKGKSTGKGWIQTLCKRCDEGEDGNDILKELL